MQITLVTFPYLGFRNERIIFGKKLWNYFDRCEVYIPDKDLRNFVTNIIKMQEHPEWVCVLGAGKINIDIVWQVQILLFISSVSKGNTTSNQEYWVTSEHFSFTQLNINTEDSEFKFRLDPILSKVWSTMLIKNSIIHTPKNISSRNALNTVLDEKLLKALLKTKSKNRELYKAILESAEMMFVPLLNESLIPVTVVLALIVSCFQTLFKKEGRKEIKDELDRLFVNQRKFATKYEINGKFYPDSRTAFAIWFEHLCRHRNTIVHGKGLSHVVGHYNGQSYRYVGMLLWIKCIRSLIEQKVGITLSGSLKRVRGNNGKPWFTYI